MKTNKAAITKGLLGKMFTETINGKKVVNDPVQDVTFPNESSVRLFFQDRSTPLTLSIENAVSLIENRSLTFDSAKGWQICLILDEIKKKSKKAK